MERRKNRRGLFWPTGAVRSPTARVQAGRAAHWAAAVVAGVIFSYAVLAAQAGDAIGALNLASGTCYAMAVFLLGRMFRLVLSDE